MRNPRTSRALRAAFTTCLIAVPSLARSQGLASDTSWVRRAALYEVFVQDFSPAGNFRGVQEGLHRIKDAGANVIWLMPVHPIGVVGRKGELGSPYAAKDYRAINPSYGTAADLKALVTAAHAESLKVILDWVPDHTSPDHPWVKAHPDWYFRDAKGQPSVPRDEKGNLTDWTDVVQLDFGSAALRQAMTETMQYWLREYDLDGFRVDVAGFVPNAFWREAIPALRASVKRPILMLAEWGTHEMHRSGFDLTYSWDSYKRLKGVWQGDSAAAWVRREVSDLDSMPKGGMRMRFTTNHDETAWDKTPVAIFGKGAGARAAFVAAALMPGRPLLYNGQEVESPQQLPLFSRMLVEWNQPGADSARALYRRVMQLTRTQPALRGLDLAAVQTTKPKDIIAYRRGDIVVLVNPRDQAVRFTVKGVKLAGMRDLLTGLQLPANSMSLPAHGALVLAKGKR